MGESLSPIDFGSSFKVAKAYTSAYGVCAMSTDGELKCCGYNENGQLGLGDKNNRGDGPDEMGEFLPNVDLGAGFVVQDMSAGNFHKCALSTTGNIKCWGSGTLG